MNNNDTTTCEYDNGRVCGKTATVIIYAKGFGAPSCNRHRVATANMVATKYGEAHKIELPREMNMYTHRAEVEGGEDREFVSAVAAIRYANEFEFAKVVQLATGDVVHQTFALAMRG